MTDKPDTKEVIGTHAYTQEVLSCNGITANMKVVLAYLLQKYQATDSNGNRWNFSNASIENGTKLPRRTVYNVTTVLIKHKVLKECGEIKRKTRPTLLYYFHLTAMIDLLKTVKRGVLTLEKDNAKRETNTLPNDSNAATAIEAPLNNGDSAKDNAKDNATIAYHKEEYKKKSTEEEKKGEVQVLSTANSANALNDLPQTKAVIIGLDTIQGVRDYSTTESSYVIGQKNNKHISGSIGESHSLQRSVASPQNRKPTMYEAVVQVVAEEGRTKGWTKEEMSKKVGLLMLEHNQRKSTSE